MRCLPPRAVYDPRCHGPSYTTRDLVQFLGVSRQAIDFRVRNGSLIRLRALRPGGDLTDKPANDEYRYPVWQVVGFGPGKVSQASVRMIRVWRRECGDDVDPGVIATWAHGYGIPYDPSPGEEKAMLAAATQAALQHALETMNTPMPEGTGFSQPVRMR